MRYGRQPFRMCKLRVRPAMLVLAVTPALYCLFYCNLSLTFLPKAWGVFSIWEVLVVKWNMVADYDMGMLRPCTLYYADDNKTPTPIRDDIVVDILQWRRAESYVKRLTPERAYNLTAFLPQLSPTDKAELLTLWRLFDDTLSACHVAYGLLGGSLLGAVRHHAMIPWDDDIDVFVFEKDLPRLLEALSCVPGHALRVQDNYHFKFFRDDSKIIPTIPEPTILHANMSVRTDSQAVDDRQLGHQKIGTVVMRFPFIDIFVLRHRGRISFQLSSLAYTMAYPTSSLLPLAKGTFEGYSAPLPNKPLDVLENEFQLWQCVSPSMNHRKNKVYPRKISLDCKELWSMYTF